MKCETCRERGKDSECFKVVAGTPMCRACYNGEAHSVRELVGSIPDRDGEYHWCWYEKNRDRILSEKARKRATA
jgi:hypothetical protein